MLSVIIPVFNEAAIIQQTLSRLLETTSENVEIIVVDGGSHDNTFELAQALGVKVIIASNRGRANQMNQGALLATGDILLFLHADTTLPSNYPTIVREILSQPNTIAGAFALKIDDNARSLRIVETLVNWRSRFLSLPYGDQAIFLPTSVFREMGGFSPMPIMEDFELILRLRKKGRINIAKTNVLTSSRRWQKLGVIKTTAINQLIILGYFLGISPDKLARWYRRK